MIQPMNFFKVSAYVIILFGNYKFIGFVAIFILECLIKQLIIARLFHPGRIFLHGVEIIVIREDL